MPHQCHSLPPPVGPSPVAQRRQTSTAVRTAVVVHAPQYLLPRTICVTNFLRGQKGTRYCLEFSTHGMPLHTRACASTRADRVSHSSNIPRSSFLPLTDHRTLGGDLPHLVPEATLGVLSDAAISQMAGTRWRLPDGGYQIQVARCLKVLRRARCVSRARHAQHRVCRATALLPSRSRSPPPPPLPPPPRRSCGSCCEGCSSGRVTCSPWWRP